MDPPSRRAGSEHHADEVLVAVEDPQRAVELDLEHLPTDILIVGRVDQPDREALQSVVGPVPFFEPS
ncbi:hypothetical protein ACFO1B_27075 [Dactylosporangium siamense]|uniref:hypothetical protein n=1 Tax=Dactylosporangium siamense TaxID=685454 RepID=UPI001942E55E|nr:hypothetical protein [Dactylosporangium siamense]